uniref:C2H2-type domain-containing protein n=1 Tax=Kalanchoe fedtschenkoi TaxID=63787 RepID=A0A7N0TQB9_KALFE
MEPQRAANDNSNANSGGVYRCKFCGMECLTKQSLGGHSNVHRRERIQQQMQAVEAVRRRFRYIPCGDGYAWATEDDSSYFQMRPLHPPSLEYAIPHERSSVQPLKLRMAIAPQVRGMPVVFNSNNVDDEGVDLTLRL